MISHGDLKENPCRLNLYVEDLQLTSLSATVDCYKINFGLQWK